MIFLFLFSFFFFLSFACMEMEVSTLCVGLDRVVEKRTFL